MKYVKPPNEFYQIHFGGFCCMQLGRRLVCIPILLTIYNVTCYIVYGCIHEVALKLICYRIGAA